MPRASVPCRSLSMVNDGEAEPPRLTTLDIAKQIFDLALLMEDAKDDEERNAIGGELLRLIDGDLAIKVDGIGVVKRRMEAEKSLSQDEQNRFLKQRQRLDRARQRINGLLMYVMEKLGTDVLRGRTTTIRKNEGIVSTVPEIYDRPALPPKYLKQVVTYEPDNELIMHDLVSEIEVPGARMKKGDAYLTFTS